MRGIVVGRQLFRSGSVAVLSAVVVATFAAQSFAQPPRAPVCAVDGMDMKKLPKAKADLGTLPNVPLGRQTVDDAIRVIEDTKAPPGAADAAKARVPAARDACAGALNSKTMANLPAHLCVALSDYALGPGKTEAAKCRVDWIDFLGGQLPNTNDRNRLLGDAQEIKAKILYNQNDFAGAMAAYEKAAGAGAPAGYWPTTSRLLRLAELQERYPDKIAAAIGTYQRAIAQSDIGEKKYDVLRNWALLVSKTGTLKDKRERWKALVDYRSTPEANYRYAETFLQEGPSDKPDPEVIKALNAATVGPAGDEDQANARSRAWYYLAVFAARSANTRDAWKTVAQYAGDGSADPRASRLKCIAEVASGGNAGSCPSAASTAEQYFLRGIKTLRESQFLPSDTKDYSKAWLDKVGEAEKSFSDGRDRATDRDLLDWLELGDQKSPKVQELLKGGEAIARDWQRTRPGYQNCSTFPALVISGPEADKMFESLDLKKCAHKP